MKTKMKTKTKNSLSPFQLNQIKGGGAVVFDVEYDAFGVPTIKSKPTFNGKIYDTSN
jgi:hypothetical protein